METLNNKISSLLDDLKKLNVVNNGLKESIKELQKDNKDLLNNPLTVQSTDYEESEMAATMIPILEEKV